MASQIFKPVFGAKTAITLTAASLGSDTTQLIGQSSAQIDNSSTLYDDILFSGFMTVGTTPTINKLILLLVAGAMESFVTTNIDTLAGTDAAKTITSVGIREGFLKPVAQLLVDATTSNRKYPYGIVTATSIFNGPPPPFLQFFLTHNTGVNLNSTGSNHAFYYQGVHYRAIDE